MGTHYPDGFPNSAFRRVEAQWKCRCGNPSDKRWHLTLSDPAGMRTLHVPLCGSCGPVLFDKLAGEGWLTSPITGETLAKTVTELAEKEIAPPDWTCNTSGQPCSFPRCMPCDDARQMYPIVPPPPPVKKENP